MCQAIMDRNYRKVVFLAINCGVSIDMETPSGSTALIGAAEEDTGVPFYSPMFNEDGSPCLAIEFLLDRSNFRPSVNLEAESGHNALIRACSLGRGSCAEALLDRGADVNYVNKYGKSPLHYAATVGSYIVCRILLERGADVHKATPEGETAYSIADEYGFLPIMQQMGRHSSGFMGPVRPNRGRVDVFVRCPMGCGESMDPTDVKEHEFYCVNRIVKCPQDCGERLIMAKELDRHMSQECGRRQVPCVYCGKKDEQRLQEKHFATTCGHRDVDCVMGCGKQIKVVEMKKHLKFCTWRMVRCTQGCGEEVKVRDMFDHDKNACENRKIPCPLKCQSLVSNRLLKHHQMNVCPNRIEPCRWCDEDFVYRHLDSHEKSCHIRKEPCPASCGELVTVGEPTKLHMVTDCKHRFVHCDSKCGQKVRFADMGGHLKHLCGNRLVPCPLKCWKDPDLPPLQVSRSRRFKGLSISLYLYISIFLYLSQC